MRIKLKGPKKQTEKINAQIEAEGLNLQPMLVVSRALKMKGAIQLTLIPMDEKMMKSLGKAVTTTERKKKSKSRTRKKIRSPKKSNMGYLTEEDRD